MVFCGTPLFAVPALEMLVEAGFPVRLVITQPDRPKGRGLELQPSPVKTAAEELALPVFQPEKIKTNEELRSRLAAISPAAIVVVGYGRMVPPWMLHLPTYGNINLHASLLPKYRGAAPIQWAIASGEKFTGVTTIRLDEGLDTGDVLLQREATIADDDTSESLARRLARMGADLLIETLAGLQAGSINPRPQNQQEASLAPLLKRQDGDIDFRRSAREIYNRLRAFQPWPGAFTRFRGKTLNIMAARPARAEIEQARLLINGTQLFVGCGDQTALELVAVQPEGKKAIGAADFIRGYRPQTGERIGS
ncbi:MAG: methionyl-tRNA formyltransferase [Acidobacteria bacterium]|nr:methionyl-tRNA formyltransferase [Acidobacteriota bacterium]